MMAMKQRSIRKKWVHLRDQAEVGAGGFREGKRIARIDILARRRDPSIFDGVSIERTI
jgi:hypothetical protein